MKAAAVIFAAAALLNGCGMTPYAETESPPIYAQTAHTAANTPHSEIFNERGEKQ